MNLFSDWFKAIQLKPRFLFGFFILGILILLLPKDFAYFFGITDLRNQYRGWIGVGTLAAFCFWLVQLWPKFRDWLDARQEEKKVLKNLNTLTKKEYLVLAFRLHRGTQRWNETEETREIDFGEYGDSKHEIYSSLFQQGLLLEESVSIYQIPLFVWKHLQKNKSKFLSQYGNNPKITS